jgi:deoxycytidine triphosphate deaminase
MSIKSDKWIRRMALEHGMIEPFVERQVRAEGAQALISYGVSSYGYDVRCADEFKVFRKALSTLKATCASSRRTRLPWRGRSSFSAFHETY